MKARWQSVPTNLRHKLERFNLPQDTYWLLLEVLISQHSNMLGVFRCPNAYLMADLSWKIERVDENLNRLIEIQLVYNDPEKSLLMIDPTLEMNPIEDYRNAPTVNCALKVLHFLPPSKIYEPLVVRLKSLNRPLIDPIIKKLQKLSRE